MNLTEVLGNNESEDLHGGLISAGVFSGHGQSEEPHQPHHRLPISRLFPINFKLMLCPLSMSSGCFMIIE